MNEKENKEILDQWWEDHKVNKYTPAGEEIGKQETKEDREQAENILQSLEKDLPKHSQNKPISWPTWAWREEQTKVFSQNHPDKIDRIPAANDLLTTLQQPQTGNPLGRAFQWLSQKILGPQNT